MGHDERSRAATQQVPLLANSPLPTFKFKFKFNFKLKFQLHWKFQLEVSATRCGAMYGATF
jgi:hypothetical protein